MYQEREREHQAPSHAAATGEEKNQWLFYMQPPPPPRAPRDNNPVYSVCTNARMKIATAWKIQEKFAIPNAKKIVSGAHAVGASCII